MGVIATVPALVAPISRIPSDSLPGYKATEVGTIPVDWSVAKLGLKATFRTGPFGSALHKSDYMADGIPVVNPMHIVEGSLVPTSSMTVSESVARALSDFRLLPGELIIGRRGEMGRVAVICEEHAGWVCGTGSMIIRCSSDIEPEFLRLVLSSPTAIAAIENTSVGSTMINLNQATLAGLSIQLPSRPEQRAIAAALSDVDSLIAALNALIAKKRAIKQATMQQLLTGKTRLPGFERTLTLVESPIGPIPSDWSIERCNNMCVKIQDGTHFSPQLGGNEFLYVTSKNIRPGRLDLADVELISEQEHRKIYARCDTRRGDLLLTKDGANTGNAAMNTLDQEVSLLSSVAFLRIKTSRYDPRFYLQYILSSSGQWQIKELMSGNAITRLTLQKIRQLMFPAPSLLEQQAIAQVLSDMDAEIEALEARVAKTRDIKQGMMQQLLTGRIRLVTPTHLAEESPP